MILCCKSCGNCFESEKQEKECDYCCGKTDILFSDEEVDSIDKYELERVLDFSREKYKVNNEDYNRELWNSREYRDTIKKKRSAEGNIFAHMITTGFSFDGYTIVSYKGVTSGQVVLGTGFLSEFTAQFADFFGKKSNIFGKKIEKAKNAAVQKLIEKSVELGGNAVWS